MDFCEIFELSFFTLLSYSNFTLISLFVHSSVYYSVQSSVYSSVHSSFHSSFHSYFTLLLLTSILHVASSFFTLLFFPLLSLSLYSNFFRSRTRFHVVNWRQANYYTKDDDHVVKMWKVTVHFYKYLNSAGMPFFRILLKKEMLLPQIKMSKNIIP